jgi:hypothetical protein
MLHKSMTLGEYLTFRAHLAVYVLANPPYPLQHAIGTGDVPEPVKAPGWQCYPF